MSGLAPSIAELSSRVLKGLRADQRMAIDLAGCRVAVNSNSDVLIERLKDYFGAFVCEPEGQTDIRILALQMSSPDLGLDFTDWPREAGKKGRKDSYIDLADGRALRKVKTGMQYLMGHDQMMIFGDCLANDNQVVNFVIAQQIGWLMHRDWVLCHAAAVAWKGEGLAISAFSGGGKSTLALHLMNDGLDFISNDRTLISRAAGLANMHGVPKHPRINPGTILNNASLAGLLNEEDVMRLQAMPKEALWALEEKYDARIDTIFGAGRFHLAAKLKGMAILNWSHASSEPVGFREVDIAARPDLLAAVMKAPGPFFIPEGDAVPKGISKADPQDYIPILSKVTVFEVTGRTDFEAAVKYFRDFLGN